MQYLVTGDGKGEGDKGRQSRGTGRGRGRESVDSSMEGDIGRRGGTLELEHGCRLAKVGSGRELAQCVLLGLYLLSLLHSQFKLSVYHKCICAGSIWLL